MCRRTSLVFALCLTGCSRQPGPVAAPTSMTVTETSITFDPATCRPERATLHWGLGSVTVEIIGRDDGECVFEYIDEVEMGYKRYRCRVPADSGPVRIEYRDSVDHGTHVEDGFVTSFALDDAELIETGGGPPQ